MATDYTSRLYWPSRGADSQGEARTTYGKTIALTAHLHKGNLQQEKLMRENQNRGITTDNTRRSSRLFERLPPLHKAQSISFHHQQYTMNRIRGIQSQVPMTREVQTFRQQNTVRSAPSKGGSHFRKELKDMRLRQGRAGGNWIHAREVMQSKGEKLLYIDGNPSIEERIRNITANHQLTQDYSNQKESRERTALSTTEYKTTEGANWRLVR